MAALDAARTGTMQDIVATIQAEQDRIIRAPLEGIMIVDGAPGTGKTAVALHRAAYLLYEHREQLKRRGVLIIGPGKQFLRYISEVLPGLAETDVLLRTPAQLFPGVVADRPETEAVAAVKGRAVMAGVIASAVADRQVVPREPLPVDFEGHELYLRPEKITAARDAARETGLPHNEARETFHKRVIADLATQYADIIGEDPLGGENLLGLADRAQFAVEIAHGPGDPGPDRGAVAGASARRSCWRTCSRPGSSSPRRRRCSRRRSGRSCLRSPAAGARPTWRCSTRPRSTWARSRRSSAR